MKKLDSILKNLRSDCVLLLTGNETAKYPPLEKCGKALRASILLFVPALVLVIAGLITDRVGSGAGLSGVFALVLFLDLTVLCVSFMSGLKMRRQLERNEILEADVTVTGSKKRSLSRVFVLRAKDGKTLYAIPESGVRLKNKKSYHIWYRANAYEDETVSVTDASVTDTAD